VGLVYSGKKYGKRKEKKRKEEKIWEYEVRTFLPVTAYCINLGE